MGKSRRKEKWDFDAAVIGGGPGGLVSALYLRRFRRSVAVFRNGKPRACWAPKLHNLLGFTKGISGKALVRQLTKQVAGLGGVAFFDAKAELRRVPGGFEASAGGRRLRVRKAILATGISDEQPALTNLTELRGLGLLRYCPICDAFEHRRKKIFVLVRDDECAGRAQFLRHYTGSLTVILPRHVKLSAQRRAQLRKIGAATWRGKLEAIRPAKARDALLVKLEGQRPRRFDAGYVELGFRVNDEAFARIRGIKRVDSGLLRTTGEQRVSVPGLFAVGDCVNRLAQVSVAAGQAAVAATALHNDLLQEDSNS